MNKTAGVVALMGVGLLATVALAGHTEPAKAKKFTFDLMNSYYGPFGCQSPNTQTNSQFGGGWPACAPVVPSATFGCAFTPTASGKLTVAVIGTVDKGTQDIKMSAVAKGLNASCEGEQLCITFDFRATTDDCPEGSCTTTDAVDFDLPPPFCCIVSGGACKIPSASVATGFPGFFLNNRNTGIELLGCGLQPRLPGASGNAVSCGILLK